MKILKKIIRYVALNVIYSIGRRILDKKEK